MSALPVTSHNNAPWLRHTIRTWALIFLVVLIWHLVVYWIGREAGIWIASLRPAIVPPPAEVTTLSQERIEALRKQWKKRSLLLGESAKGERTEKAPEDARYFSDKNIRVQKEQRAKDMANIPAPTGSTDGADDGTQSKHSKLDSLGVPLTPGPGGTAKARENEGGETRKGRSDGGSQFVQENDLAVGAENLLNAASHPGYGYMKRLREEIVPRWEMATSAWQGSVLAGPGSYVTVATITIDRRGNVIRVEYPKLSGVRELDQAVEYAIGRFDRFPNPPPALFQDEEGNPTEEFTSTWSFTVTVNRGGPARWAPPRRVR